MLLGLPAAASAEDVKPPSLAYVGDSIGVQSQIQIQIEVERTRPLGHLIVTNGAPLNQIRHEVVDAVHGTEPPSIVVVGLGHAQVNWGFGMARHERDLRRFLDDTAPFVDCVRWFQVKPRGTYYDIVNRDGRKWNALLARVAADYPNVEVYPYATWARLTPERSWYRDDLHLSRTGVWEMGRMVRQAADGCDPAISSGPFWDVPDASPAAGPIAWMHDNGLVDGFPDGTYRARIGSVDVPTTRGQLASILWRRAGSPRGARPASWTDTSRALAPALAWVQESHLLAGYPAARFRPNEPVTRGQLVRALWVDAGRLTGFAPAPWTDVKPRLRQAAAWAYATGLLGETGDTLRRNDPIGRGALAEVLAPDEVQGPLRPPPPAPGPFPDPEIHVVDVEDPILVAPR
jgi:hypothetical protein